jgi:F5/8 type C domain-containing protein
MRRCVPFVLAGVLYTALTTALTWPLVLSPGRSVPNDLGDPLLNTYLLAWNARTMPLTERWWSVPQFYPQRGVTAYSEHLLGLTPIAAPIIWLTGNPLLAYNAAFFLSFVLCGLSAHLLAYVLTRRHDVGVLAGLAFAFAPYRMSQIAHLQVLSAYWMPLSLVGLHLYFADRRGRWLALVGGAWLMQALSCGYYLFYLSALIALWLVWFAVGRERWSDVLRVSAVWVLAGMAMAPIAIGYVKYQSAAGLRRWPDEIESFSADIASVLKAPDSLWVWGWLDVIGRPESALFPGLTVVLLTVIGASVAWRSAARSGEGRLTMSRWLLLGSAALAAIAATPSFIGPWKIEPFGLRLLSVTTARKPLSLAILLAIAALIMHPAVIRAWRRRSTLAFYALATGAMWLFSLGPSPTFMNKPLIYKAPYAWLMLIPGVDGVRVPARFWVLGTLCLAIAAALGVAHITMRWPRLRAWLPIVAAAFILLDAWPRPIRVIVGPDARPPHASAVARLELPVNPAHDPIVLYRAALHRRPVINGYSGYFAPHYWALQYMLEQRDPAILARLSAMGTIEAVIDHDLDADRSWRRFVASHPEAAVAYQDETHTVYRIGRTQPASASMLPSIEGEPLQIARVSASLYQDLVGNLTDGNRITRWDTGGPQDPTNALTLDLGTTRHVTGVEQQIAGFVADFPRALTVETSIDGTSWSAAWTGGTALLAFSAALEEPLTIPLRTMFEARPARFVRLRQTGGDKIYYWSIAELRVFGWGLQHKSSP